MIDMSKVHKDVKYNCGTPMPCMECGKRTTQRVETSIDIGTMLGEEPCPFYAPICDECLDQTEQKHTE